MAEEKCRTVRFELHIFFRRISSFYRNSEASALGCYLPKTKERYNAPWSCTGPAPERLARLEKLIASLPTLINPFIFKNSMNSFGRLANSSNSLEC